MKYPPRNTREALQLAMTTLGQLPDFASGVYEESTGEELSSFQLQRKMREFLQNKTESKEKP